MQASRQHTTVLPVISLLVAASLWGIFWYPLRVLEDFGLNGLWSSLLIYSGTLIFAIPLTYRHRHQLRIHPWLLLGILLCSGWCNTAFILAIIQGEVVRVILLFYLSPIWATLLARFVLKERPGPLAYLTTLIALVGAMTMLWSPQVGYPWPYDIADWLAISSGLAFAFTNLYVHMAQGVSIELKTSISWVGVIVVAGMILLLQAGDISQLQLTGVILALVFGVVGMSVMTFCVVYGVTHMPVHRSAVILLFEVFAGAVSAYFLTSERMSTREWIGGAVVIFAAYLAARQHKKSEQSNEVKTV